MGLLRGELRKGSTSATARQKKEKDRKETGAKVQGHQREHGEDKEENMMR